MTNSLTSISDNPESESYNYKQKLSNVKSYASLISD